MRVLHLNAGNETGGGMHHILNLLSQFDPSEVILGLFEKGEMYDRAIKLGIPTILFEQRNQKDLTVLPKLVKYIKKEKLSFIHTHGPRATFFMSLIKKFIDQPLITTIHSNPCDDFLGKGLKGKLCYLMYKASFNYVDHFIVVSTAFKKVMKNKFKIREDKISVILNGIDFNLNNSAYTKRELGFSENDFLILMAARLEPVKQHHLALESFRKVLQTYANAKLILVGDGSCRKRIEDYIETNSLQQSVYLFGHRDDLQKIFPTVDLILLTSKSESFPLVLLEAARAKVPIVTTNVGDVSKLIPSSDYGWIVTDVESNRIANAIQEAIISKENKEIDKMTFKLFQYASNQFSLKHFHNSVRQIYKGLQGYAKMN